MSDGWVSGAKIFGVVLTGFQADRFSRGVSGQNAKSFTSIFSLMVSEMINQIGVVRTGEPPPPPPNMHREGDKLIHH